MLTLSSLIRPEVVRLFMAVACGFLVTSNFASAQGTAFTYQGQLRDASSPATGNYDFQFKLYDAIASGNQIGAGLTNAPIVVSNGLFTVLLDFGTNASGAGHWLEIGVRTNGSVAAYTILSPRQAITPTPHALFADNAGVSVASNLTGILPDSAFPATLPAVSGANLTSLPASNLTGTLPFGVFPTTSMALQTTNNPQFYAGTSYGGIFYVLGNLRLDLGGASDMFWNPSHPGGGEFQITSQGSMSLNVGYNNQAQSTLQVGSTGPTHETINFQYDYFPNATYTLGYSKNVRWAANYWNGSGVQYKYAGMRHEILDTTGNSRIAFYNPSPEVRGTLQNAVYSGGVLQGAVLTNGWELDGKIVNNLVTSNPNVTYAIDFNGAKNNQLLLAGDTTFSVTNLPANNQAEEISIDIYSEISAKNLAFPTNGNNVRWIWRNEAGTLTAPTALALNKVMFLRLRATVSSSYTNIDATYTLGTYEPSVDPDASTFFAAAQLTNSIQMSAVNQLALDLKTANLWTKMDCIYPFVGGNATAHSKNLKDTTHFNITWNNSPTMDSNGVTGDGISMYGDTGFAPTSGSPNYTQNSSSIGVYSKTTNPTCSAAGSASPTYIGDVNGGFRSSLYFIGGTVNNGGMNNANNRDNTTFWAPGLQVLTRTASNAQKICAGINAAAASTSSTGLPTSTFYALAENNGGLWHPSSANISFAFIGSGLSDSDVAALNTAVVRFETSLNRQ